ncbi:3-ketoacyl-CoA synthase 21 [Actinidia rufa]|uniref:3-ketoacyl-CoA synthase n=1 Tax=Actinidia rufa TaxID=165716 RepID=A0A7J0HFF8_9ERIC|nr:3-ketoacyl-CoA synthase 21 [Actinidia rufa]
MASILQLISGLVALIWSITNHNIVMVVMASFTVLYLVYKRRVAIFLLDFNCYRPPDSLRLPMSMYVEHIVNDGFDPDAIAFQVKILARSGFSQETCIPPPLRELPIIKSISYNEQEAKTVIFTAVKDLLEKNKISPKAIDILITNSSMFSPTPSLSAMVINEFKMRSNIRSFNLSGMGCSAGIVSASLANDLLRVHRNSLALIVSSEILSPNWYTGKNHSMLLTNCLFRMGGAAIVLSSRVQDENISKYKLKHVVRTNRAKDDRSYACVYQDVDLEGKTGISISKTVVSVAGEALKANMALLGPMVLPYSEQIKYGLSLVWQRRGQNKVYVPDFNKVFNHFCVHAGGKAVILAIEKGLKLKEEDMEASKMTLYRFGNTSSSSIWYELSYMEAKRKMKKGDRVWQIALGSGFKCNSAVWKCLQSIEPEKDNAWSDRVDSYPVDVPDIVKIG